MNHYLEILGRFLSSCLKIIIGIALVLLIAGNCMMLYHLDKERVQFNNTVRHLDVYLKKTEPKYADFIADFEQAESERKAQEAKEVEEAKLKNKLNEL